MSSYGQGPTPALVDSERAILDQLTAYRDIDAVLKSFTAAPIHSHANRRVIYTAIIGASDTLRDPLLVEPDVDYVCFTNDSNLNSRIWKIVYVDIGTADPAWAAKIPKILPHKILHEYKESIWVDGSFLLRRSLWALVRSHMRPESASIGLFVHPNRPSIYDEADACIAQGKDDAHLIRRQVDRYRKEGYPGTDRLVACGFIYRRHEEHIADLMEKWLEQIRTYSIRDQLSFNYAAWKGNAQLGRIHLNQYDNEYFVVMPHKKIAGYVIRSIWRLVSQWLRSQGLVPQGRPPR